MLLLLIFSIDWLVLWGITQKIDAIAMQVRVVEAMGALLV